MQLKLDVEIQSQESDVLEATKEVQMSGLPAKQCLSTLSKQEQRRDVPVESESLECCCRAFSADEADPA